jgi:IS30 family transposase
MGERSCIYSCKNHLQLFNPTEKIVMPASAVNEMVVMTMAKNKHLVNEERSQIEHLLRNGKSIKEIARTLDKSTSTISREIKKRAVPSDKSAAYRVRNRCVHRRSCKKIQLCEDKPDCTRRCSACSHCNSVCPDFVEEICLRLSSPPYVCNGCVDERKCTLRKQYYLHRPAQKSYKELLVGSRAGANISEEELLRLDGFLSPLIRKGQSVHHIFATNPDEFTCCEKTIYRYVNDCLLSARNIDMPRVCRLKPRKSKPKEYKVDKKCRTGRTYADYLEHMAANPDTAVVEMDTVEGNKGGSVLLTLHFRSCSFMLAFLRDRNTSQSVIEVFRRLISTLGKEAFRRLFPVILTDNGTEFSNPLALEFAEDGDRITSIYYCNPSSPFQKPTVENNHEFIRRVLPKGSSFDDLTQADINLMMEHINSYTREKLNDKSPYESFSFFYGQGILDALGVKLIPNNDIILRPSLLKR